MPSSSVKPGPSALGHRIATDIVRKILDELGASLDQQMFVIQGIRELAKAEEAFLRLRGNDQEAFCAMTLAQSRAKLCDMLAGFSAPAKELTLREQGLILDVLITLVKICYPSDEIEG